MIKDQSISLKTPDGKTSDLVSWFKNDKVKNILYENIRCISLDENNECYCRINKEDFKKIISSLIILTIKSSHIYLLKAEWLNDFYFNDLKIQDVEQWNINRQNFLELLNAGLRPRATFILTKSGLNKTYIEYELIKLEILINEYNKDQFDTNEYYYSAE